MFDAFAGFLVDVFALLQRLLYLQRDILVDDVVYFSIFHQFHIQIQLLEVDPFEIFFIYLLARCDKELVGLFVPNGFGFLAQQDSGDLFFFELIHFLATQSQFRFQFANLLVTLVFLIATIFQAGKHLNVYHNAFHARLGLQRAVGKITGSVAK